MKHVGTPLRALALGIGENKGVHAPDGDQVATADPSHGYGDLSYTEAQMGGCLWLSGL